MKNGKWKRFLSGLMSTAMVVTMMPTVSFGATASEGAESTGGVLAHFTFDDEETGLTGGGATAQIHGSGITFESDAAIGKSIKIDNSSYLSVTNDQGKSPLTGQEEITLNYYSKPTCSATGWTFFAVRDGETPAYLSEHYLGILDQTGSMKVERYLSNGSRSATNDVSGSFTDWKMVTVVFSENSTALYINGEKQNTVASDLALTDILGENSTLQIGKANWAGGEYYKGYVDELTIYDHTLSDSEIMALYTGDIVSVTENEVIASLGGSKEVIAEEDLKLITETTTKAKVSWTSSDEAVVSSVGKVTRPGAGEVNAKAVLTALITMTDGQTSTVEFAVTVPAKMTDEAVLEKAAAEISINKFDEIKGNITLPTKNSYGAVVTWKSSNPEVISDKELVNEDYDNMPAGVVTRQNEDTKVTLTATIAYGEASLEKSFECTVLKKAEEKKLENYLFAFFPSNSQEQLYFATGKDHLHFTDLNDGEPVLTSTIGDQGVRDPYIFRSAEGDHFYMLATDLKVQTSGWDKAQYRGSLEMVVWESDDLVNWTEARLVDVGLNDLLLSDEDITNLGCLWAPEAIYDEKTGEYVVFWASMTTIGGVSYQVTYYSKTRDFVNFTEATKYIDRGSKQHCIDSTIVKADGKYYRASVCGTANGGTVGEIMLETSDSILGDWTKLCDMNDLQSGMEGFDEFYSKSKKQFITGTVEGTELFTLNDGKTWGLYTDNYGGVGYIPVTTTDLSDTTGASWKVYQTSEYNFGSLKKRHGSILGITAEEYEAVMEKWQTKPAETPVVKDEEEKEEPVLSYDFETESIAGKIDDASGNNNTGLLVGNAKIVKDNEVNSGVLSLSGEKGTYAQFPTGFFDGRDKFTISFDMKSKTTSGNFFNLAIGKDSTKYIYLRARSTDTYLAITTNSWGAEEGISTSTDDIYNDWHNYTVVFADSKMNLYIDGLLAESKEINNKVSAFGKDVIAYLGKSFYSADNYVEGLYDNVKVYNRGLSEEEVAKNNGIKVDGFKKVTSESVSIITQNKNKETGEVVLYVSKNNSKDDLTAAKLNIKTSSTAKLVAGESKTYDLTKPFDFTVEDAGIETSYTVKTVICNNPVLGGEFADPDIDCFNGKYYIYPTTDGYSGWSGYQFHVFSSDDLINWKDEGLILDLKASADYKDENGRTVAAVPWSDGSAWAPTIEEKDGMYYFYFCGNDTASNSKAIGVAYSTSPTGPFTVADEPLITYASSKAMGVAVGQAIDPSVFKDVDGTYYLSYGNGNGTAGLAKLGEDMMSIESATAITGLKDFRESLIITYRDGLYHYTWSCDDTGSENYHINYGVSTKLGQVNYKYTILYKDKEQDILGTGHHSILNVPGTDEWYIAYHRFMTPLGQISGGYGYHRETCIDKLTFDEKTGLMEKVTPTLEGITKAVYVPKEEPEVTPEATPEATPTAKPEVTPETTPEATPTAKPEVTPEATPEATPTAKPEVTPTATPTAIPTPVVNSEEKAPEVVTNPEVIISSKVSVKAVKAGKKKFTVSWKKTKSVDGYRVQYSTSKKFDKKSTKTITIKSSKITTKTIKSLKAKRKYYVRIGSYKLDSKGNKVYSAWSSAKNIKTK